MYGYDDEAYAAQMMLATYRAGMDVGDAYGDGDSSAVIGAAIEGVVGLATAGIAIGHQAKQAKSQRQHEAAMAKQQARLYELQAQAAAAQAAVPQVSGLSGGDNTLLFVGLGLVGLLVVVGGGGYYVWQSQKKG